MPKFLEDKLKAEYGAKSKIPYIVMNKIGAMRGNKVTTKGEAMQRKHDEDMETPEMEAKSHSKSFLRKALNAASVANIRMKAIEGKSDMMAIPKGFHMPTLEAIDYERFSYDSPSDRALTLDEAVKQARDLRQNDKEHFYRVEWANEAHSAFKVTKVPVSSAYAEFLTHVTRLMGRYVPRNWKR